MPMDSEQTTSIPTQQVHEYLTSVFGFNEFREGQEPVVSRLLQGKSTLAVFPTGGGKSLCYQLPSLVFDSLTVVISPLIALMKDQLDFLIARGVPAGRLDSSLSREEYIELFEELHAGRLKLLYISPERLSNERFLHTLEKQKIALLTIDEAHCISEWGHNFRPDYLKIARLARKLAVERVLALTATATPKVASDICKAFDIAPDDMVHTGFYRPNLRLYVSPCAAAQRDTMLLERLRERPQGPAIVYVTLQKTAERVAKLLCDHGLDAQAYHAGMETDARTAVQNAFMASHDKIIVATIAFGMGVDKKDIRYIYHYNMPKGLESYSQETGRAGRDGKESICELLLSPEDATVLENFSYGDTPDSEAVTACVEDILGQGDRFDVSVFALSRDHDIRPLVVKTLLTYLELNNIIESTGPFYSAYKFQPQRSSAQIFARVGKQRADFLRRMFRRAKKGTTWFSLDVDAVSAAIGEPRQRLVAALGYLEEVGDLVVQASGTRLGYRLVNRPDTLAPLCAALCERFQTREDNDIARIHQVLELAQHDGCVTRYILDYFGEDRGDCGHCSHCEGLPKEPLPAVAPPKPITNIAAQVRQLQHEAPGALDRPRQIARFLCGLSSPAATRAKLRQHARFGLYEHIPFRQVLEAVEKTF